MKNFNLPTLFCFLFSTAMFLIAAGSANAQTTAEQTLFIEPKTYGKPTVNQGAGKIDQIKENKQDDEENAPDARKGTSPEGSEIIRQWYQILDRNSISNAASTVVFQKSQKAPQKKLTQTRRTKRIKN